MCFVPQQRALFQRLNFQKWSDTDVFYTFWLRNVLRAKSARTVRTSQLPKVVRDRQFLKFFKTFSKCASRQNIMQFFISHLARWLCTLRFIPGLWNHFKNTLICDFSTFSCPCIFVLLTLSLLWSPFFFSSLTLPTSAFHLSILSEVWLPTFLR